MTDPTEYGDDRLSRPDRLIVFIERPRCPWCGSLNLQTQRSLRQRDGSRKRITVCRDCATNFDVIVE
jgi:hypothetical protein